MTPSRSRVTMLVLVAWAFVVPGCVDCMVPPVSPLDVAHDAPSEGGLGDVTVTIRVTDGRNGPHITAAGVVVLVAETTTDEPLDQETKPDFDPGRLSKIALRTDADGQAVAHVPSGHYLFVAAGVEGRTQEWQHFLGPGAPDQEMDVHIPLHRLGVSRTIEGVWSPQDLVPVVPPEAHVPPEEGEDILLWLPHELALADDPADEDDYRNRLVGLTAKLSWSNEPAQGIADLGIAVGPDQEQVLAFSAAPLATGLGEHDVVLALDPHASRAAQPWTIGPATDRPFVPATGIPYTLEVEASFDFYDLAADDPGCGTLFHGVPVDEVTDPVRASGTTGGPDGSGKGAERATPIVGVGLLLVALTLLVGLRRR